MKSIIKKLLGLVASSAIMVTALNVNTTCICFIHQPKLPKGAEKLRSF